MSRLLEVKNLKMHFPVKGGVFLRAVDSCKAVDGVSFHIEEGETLGLVGESGCGKSTLGKCIVKLNEPTNGSVVFEGTELASRPKRDWGSRWHRWSRQIILGAPVAAYLNARRERKALMPLRRDLQMIFQDPAESLNSRHTVRDIVAEPFIIQKLGTSAERGKWVDELLEKVGLSPAAAARFPFEFSGGQRQRIGIARAIALNPKLIICDEPVSALDVSVQSQVLNLMMDLQRDLGLSYLFIAHDLAVVNHVSDRIAVMYLGKIVELATAQELYENPRHAYTKALIEAIPQPDPTIKRTNVPLEGDVPSPINPPEGCAFGHRVSAPRYKESIGMDIQLEEISDQHWVSNCPCCVER